MAPSLIFANFDAEYRWRSTRDGQPPGVVFAQNQRLAPLLRLLPQMQDATLLIPTADNHVALREELKTQKPTKPSVTILAWAVDDRLLDLRAALQLDSPASLETTRRLNSKLYSHQLERQHQLLLPGACVLDSIAQLDEALAAFEGPWLLKHPLGVAGRDQRRGQGAAQDDDRRWATKIFTRGWSLLLEPRLQIEREYSLQFDLEPDQPAKLLGWATLLSDAQGNYRGHHVDPDAAAPQHILTALEPILDELSRQPYRGPLGIDAFDHVQEGEVVARPLCEINARYTFGRLALAIGDHLPAARPYRWVHPSRSQRPALDTLRPWPRDPQAPAGRYALPTFADPEGRSGSFVELV